MINIIGLWRFAVKSDTENGRDVKGTYVLNVNGRSNFNYIQLSLCFLRYALFPQTKFHINTLTELHWRDMKTQHIYFEILVLLMKVELGC